MLSHSDQYVGMEVYHFGKLDKNPRDVHDYTPFHLAAESGHLPVVEYLLQYVNNVDIQIDDHWYKRTPLMGASLNGHIDVVKFLIKEGADLNLRDSNNWTSLMFASQYGYLDVVKFLIEEGANPKLKDSEKKTAYVIALEDDPDYDYDTSEVLEYLEQFN